MEKFTFNIFRGTFFFEMLYIFGILKHFYFLVISSKYLFILIGRICYLYFLGGYVWKYRFFNIFVFYANCFSKMVIPIRSAAFFFVNIFSKKGIIYVNSSDVVKYYRMEITVFFLIGESGKLFIYCFFLFVFTARWSGQILKGN